MINTAVKSARLAGNIMMRHLGKIKSVSLKENPKSILTEADLECNTAIIKLIQEEFPGHSIMSEEFPAIEGNSPFKWIIDPIDGTTNFFQKIPYFCASVALCKYEEVVLGAVYNPVTKELFYAVKGKHAFQNKKRIKVSEKHKLIDSALAFSLPSDLKTGTMTLRNMAKIFPYVRAVRDFGSSALHLCDVARGSLDIYISDSIKPWDVAAGYIILKEANGKSTGIEGKEWAISTSSMVGTNGLLHRDFMRLLR